MTDQNLMRQQVLAFVNFVNLEVPLPDTLGDNEQRMARLTNTVFTILRHELDMGKSLASGPDGGFHLMSSTAQICGSVIGSLVASIVATIGTDDDKVDEARQVFTKIAMGMMHDLLLGGQSVVTKLSSEVIQQETADATQH